MRWLLNLGYVPLATAYLPLLLYQMIVLKKNRRGWLERFGFVRPRMGHKPCIWVHAVSLGEVNATKSLVAEIHRRLPAYEVVVSATTDTGYTAAYKEYHPKHVFRYPLDFSFCARRTLDRIRPAAVVLMELEVWPNFIAMCHQRGIPLGVANGRITEEKSMRRFRLPVVRAMARRMFGQLAWVGSQTDVYSERFASLGVPAERLSVTGTMKYDTALVADTVAGADALAEAMGIQRDAPLIVAGSTGPGEEEMLLGAFEALRSEHPKLQLAIVPRKPERFDEVARLIAAKGYACIRRKEHPNLVGESAREAARQKRQTEIAMRRGAVQAEKSNESPTVFLGDTVGELRAFYSLANVVFVGRSLVPMGGSDAMEVAGLGRAMCFGPYMENFAEVSEKLLAAKAAVQIPSPADLAPVLGRMLSNSVETSEMGRRAQEVVRQNVGATRRTVDLLCQSLGRRADHPASSISTRQLPENPSRGAVQL